ncbi:hypothetical protein GCM10028864_01580 [Microlunatus parietis]
MFGACWNFAGLGSGSVTDPLAVDPPPEVSVPPPGSPPPPLQALSAAPPANAADP